MVVQMVKRRAARQQKVVADIVKVRKMTAEQRLVHQDEGLAVLWENVPVGAAAIVRALKAKKLTMYAGQVEKSKFDDHFIQLQAADRLLRLTLNPVVEKDLMRPPIMIVNALGGSLGRRLAAVGFRGSRTVSIEMIKKQMEERNEK